MNNAIVFSYEIIRHAKQDSLCSVSITAATSTVKELTIIIIEVILVLNLDLYRLEKTWSKFLTTQVSKPRKISVPLKRIYLRKFKSSLFLHPTSVFSSLNSNCISWAWEQEGYNLSYVNINKNRQDSNEASQSSWFLSFFIFLSLLVNILEGENSKERHVCSFFCTRMLVQNPRGIEIYQGMTCWEKWETEPLHPTEGTLLHKKSCYMSLLYCGICR